MRVKLSKGVNVDDVITHNIYSTHPAKKIILFKELLNCVNGWHLSILQGYCLKILKLYPYNKGKLN